MKRTIYFDRYRWSDWPPVSELEPFFLAPPGQEWSFRGGNDSWGLDVDGLYGTADLPERRRVKASLTMVGRRGLGVYLDYDRWDGRIAQKHSYNSKGDVSRLGEFVESLHETPLSVGLFVSFGAAWEAVKQFMATNGELPDGIEWIAAKDVPAGAFPLPRGPGNR